MTTKYIMIHATKMVKAPDGYDDDGENPTSWDELPYKKRINLCHGEIENLDSDDWDIVTYTNLDSKNKPKPEIY